MEEIEENDYNLNISRYISTAEAGSGDRPGGDARGAGQRSRARFAKATAKHNEFLKELGLPPLPSVSVDAS